MKRHATAASTATLLIKAAELLRTSSTVSRAWRDDPELRLRAAVLLDAVGDVQRGSERCGLRFVQARGWIVSDDVSWPFSFLRICEALGMDAERLRSRLEPHFDVLLPARRLARPPFLSDFSGPWIYQSARLGGLGPRDG
jgi:hypothetical protein